MPSRSIRIIIVLGSLAIAGIIFIQGYWVSRTLDIKEDDFHQSVTIALRRVAEAISEYNKTELPKTDLINRRTSNYYSVNVNGAIDANVLEDYLFQEFEKASLNTVFEYAINDCSSDKLVYGNFCSINEDSKEFVRSENLPKFDDLIYYFVVKFPSRGSYLVDSMRQSILFSLIAFLAIAFFAYAMWVILRQKQLTELQKDFINNMTHEFKTPISSIKIASDVIRTDVAVRDNTRLVKYAEIIKTQNERLNNQVEKVLNIARLEKDQFEIKKTKLDLVYLLENFVNSEKLKLGGDNGNIVFDCTLGDATILADELHLTNVVSTIVDNAFKYCDKKPEVILSLKENEKGEYLLSIRDNGIGIKKEMQKKVFEKFYRIPTGNLHDVKGFGLGLFYVKNIIDASKWKIEVESELSKGTSFKILIPKEKN